ncbi:MULTISPECIES: DUF1289 domain-containing protein [Pseudomonas]|uniref:DUF1289 domain-containing protein n=1 Tax=Pseudomonas farsensis TaxID=2745492 RepID=A0ABU8QSG5_9PSED|nr:MULTISPECIES: DUF1289 domain-containing protein [Pseudomonas]MBC3412003.1 DUF1289 domain-containing protein [Pseudomonas sp. SWRI51]MBV4532360.1 DUF1289 domain-containing protein [Pseudomonas farsensis]
MTTAPRPAKPLYSNVSPAVPSPCISICRLDEHKVCTGCHRHVEHIREWRAADDERRRQICREAQALQARSQA